MLLSWPRVAALCLLCGACGPARENGVLGSVDLGDDFVAPQLQLDDAFFYCKLQPQVLSKYGCATGRSDEKGGCHDSRSALRLIATTDPPPCDKNGAVVSPVPDAYKANLEAVRFAVQSNPLSSPLYLRPLNHASHPRAIFSENDPAAQLIVAWIAGANR